MKRIFLLMAALVAAWGCTTVEEPGEGGGNGEREVSFTVRVPGQSVPGTRATDADEVISEIDVLIFDADGDYAGHKAGQLSGSMVNNTIKFRVYLKPGQANLVVVANAAAKVAAEESGFASKTKAQILATLTETFVPAGAAKAKVGWDISSNKIPMYGETGLVTVSADMTTTELKLRRMLARIDVSTTLDASDFKLEEIYLANYNTVGNIAPAWDADGDPVTPMPTTPWLPSGGVGAKTGADNAVRYATTTQAYEQKIYTFPAAAATDATVATAPCLVVKAEYAGESYFYRVDFTWREDPAASGFDPEKVKYMPLLRNYKYVVTITAADGIGYPTLEEALDSYTVKSNLKVKVLYYDESVIKDIVSNGQYMLGVEQSDVTLGWTGMLRTNFTVTDYEYDDADGLVEKGWFVAGVTTSPTDPKGTAAAWLTAEKETTDALKCNLNISALMNASVTDPNGTVTPAAVRTAYIHLQAGRLTHVVKVTQPGAPAAIDPAQDLPNCYMVQPGRSVTFPVSKAWLVWSSDDLGEPIDNTLPVTAELVWQDEQSLVEKVELVNGDRGGDSQIYVRARSGKQGNAVVAVKVGGEIKWSWHIWVVDYEPVDGIGSRHFMDRNLGSIQNMWTTVPSGTINTPAMLLQIANDRVVGMYYQWGRKDPLPPRPGFGTQHTWETTTALKHTVNNPTVGVGEAALTWLGSSGHKSWHTGNNSSPKTIYDPCPAGWRVPDYGIWGTFPDSSGNPGVAYGDWGPYLNAGRIYDAAFFPATLQFSASSLEAGQGYNISTGASAPTNQPGFYHYSNGFIDTDENNPRCWGMALSGYNGVTVGGNYSYAKQAGYAVRCVKDESYVAPEPADEMWARSNVVVKLDASGNPVIQNGQPVLTFAVTPEDNVTIPANVQGLLFRWGSLYGLSNTGAQLSSYSISKVRFRPPTSPAPTSSWSSIPYYNTTTSVHNVNRDEFAVAYPGIGYSDTDGLGDICRYISDKGWVEGRWRMPTAADVRQLGTQTTTKVKFGGNSWSFLAVSDINGMSTLIRGYVVGRGAAAESASNVGIPPYGAVTFPTSGYIGNTGQGTAANLYGTTWTSTPHSNANAYNMGVFTSDAYFATDLTNTGNHDKATARAIRCIRDGDPKFEQYINFEENEILAPTGQDRTSYVRIFSNIPLDKLNVSFSNQPGMEFIRNATLDRANGRLVIETDGTDYLVNELKSVVRVSCGEVSAVVDVHGHLIPEPNTGWAGSNIYWDGTRLTFDDVGVTTNEQYQGVLFKWGSLVGISPAGAYASGTRLYWPQEYTGTKPNGAAWGTIPWVDDVSNVWYVPQRAYITELTDPTVAIGDICKYLSGRPGVPAGKWRMPTYYETTGSYTQEYNSSGTWRTTSLTVPTTTIGHAGRYVPAGMWDGIRSDRIGTPFFPASGVRSETGSLSIWPAGVSGFYWNSNGGVGSGDGIHTVGVIHVAGTVPFGAGSQQHGANAVTVRCVRE